MMRQKLIVGLLVSLALLMISCEEDSWIPGTLDYTFVPITSRSGYFEERQVAYPQDISFQSRGGNIRDFNFNHSKVMVTGDLYAGDVIHGLMIDIAGVGHYVFPDITVTQSGWSIYIVDSDNRADYYNFMMDACNYLKVSGKQDIIVSGYLIDRNGYVVPNAKVEVNIYNDLDVNVEN